MPEIVDLSVAGFDRLSAEQIKTAPGGAALSVWVPPETVYAQEQGESEMRRLMLVTLVAAVVMSTVVVLGNVVKVVGQILGDTHTQSSCSTPLTLAL